jgi:signal transduction histidine kinase
MFSKINDEQKLKLMKEGLLSKTISHEIKSSLTIIQASAQLALESNNQEHFKKALMRVCHQVSEIEYILKRVKSVFVGKMENPELFNLNDFIKNLEEMYKPKMTKYNVNLILELEENIELNGEGDLLGHVFSNLMDNAIDAIKILDERWIKIKSYCKNSEIHVIITDSGSIDPAMVESIFDPLFTSKGNLGTGIGLFLVSEILKLHKATVTCSLDEKRKTQFEMIFSKAG